MSRSTWLAVIALLGGCGAPASPDGGVLVDGGAPADAARVDALAPPLDASADPADARAVDLGAPPADAAAPDAAPPDAAPSDAASPDGAPQDAGLRPAFAYTVTFSDPSGALSAERDDLVRSARAALDEWGRSVTGSGTLTVELRVMTTMTGRFSAASTSNTAIGACRSAPACTLVEEQAIRRLRSNANYTTQPSLPDVRIEMSPDYVRRELWFDPDPAARTAAVPNDRIDAISVFAHELGHAFGMVGFRSLTTFQPTVAFMSLYDDAIVVEPGALTFRGPGTVARFGPVPLTRTSATQNVFHYGDGALTTPLNDGLMNGVVFRYGVRYRVDTLDLAIVSDLGVPLRAPLP